MSSDIESLIRQTLLFDTIFFNLSDASFQKHSTGLSGYTVSGVFIHISLIVSQFTTIVSQSLILSTTHRSQLSSENTNGLFLSSLLIPNSLLIIVENHHLSLISILFL
jgi:hypothetical protein